jgi:hypothetical protein
MTVLLAPFTMHLISQMGQLLDREKAGAAPHKRADALVQALPLEIRQCGVSLGMDLGGQVEDGLLHAGGQHLSQHLEIESQMAVELWIGGIQLAAKFLQCSR